MYCSRLPRHSCVVSFDTMNDLQRQRSQRRRAYRCHRHRRQSPSKHVSGDFLCQPLPIRRLSPDVHRAGRRLLDTIRPCGVEDAVYELGHFSNLDKDCAIADQLSRAIVESSCAML